MILILNINLNINNLAFMPDNNNSFGPFGFNNKLSLIYIKHLLTISK